MAELAINAGDIAAALRKNLEGYTPATEMAQVGHIREVGDGIARVSGLPETAVNELLEFEGGTLGLALNLDEESIGAVVLGEADEIEEGHTARATGRILRRRHLHADRLRLASRQADEFRRQEPQHPTHVGVRLIEPQVLGLRVQVRHNELQRMPVPRRREEITHAVHDLQGDAVRLGRARGRPRHPAVPVPRRSPGRVHRLAGRRDPLPLGIVGERADGLRLCLEVVELLERLYVPDCDRTGTACSDESAVRTERDAEDELAYLIPTLQPKVQGGWSSQAPAEFEILLGLARRDA
jgi:hypothetical protein